MALTCSSRLILYLEMDFIPTSDAETSPSPLVVIQGVEKIFGSKQALRGVDLALPRGQISGLLGPNGAGKTTLFRLLMGVLKATQGKLSVEGLDCFEDRVAVKQLVGFLPDEPVFYSYLTGLEIIELSAGMHGLSVAESLKSIQPLAKRLGLDTALHQYAEDYSRGMKKKLGLILALLHEPQLLILDEPTNGLDVESTRIFFELMIELAQQGRTIVFSTHLLDQVERLCSHVAIIDEGQLVAKGSLDEIRQGRSLEEAFLDLTKDKKVPPLLPHALAKSYD